MGNLDKEKLIYRQFRQENTFVYFFQKNYVMGNLDRKNIIIGNLDINNMYMGNLVRK